jgi:type I restriction enzyme R subunit
MKIIAQQSESTVVTEYKSDTKRQTNYQSERELELALINQLKNQGYTFLEIHGNDDLVANLKKQLERLNKFQFTDKEWNKFLIEYLDNPNQGIVEKTKKIQEDYIYPLRREDGSLFNVF